MEFLLSCAVVFIKVICAAKCTTYMITSVSTFSQILFVLVTFVETRVLVCFRFVADTLFYFPFS